MFADPAKKFPLQYTVSSNRSDIVLVKCPNNNYQHNDKDDIFYSESKQNFMSNKAVFKNLTTEWFAVFNNKSDSNIILVNCGILRLKKSLYISVNWTANVTWSKDLSSSNHDNFLNVSEKITFWNKNNKLFIKNKNGLVSKFTKSKNISFYKGDRIYKFRRPNDYSEIEEPQTVYDVAHVFPKIDIKVDEKRKIILENNKLTKIIKNNKSETFSIELLIEGDGYRNIQFYKNENVEISIINIFYNGTQIFSPYALSLNNTVTIDYYGFISVRYYCDICLNITSATYGKTIIKDFYFGPEEKDHVESFPDITISKEEIKHKKPTCFLNHHSLYRLYEIKFENFSVNINGIALNKSGEIDEFSLYNNSIIFTNRSYNGILECVYNIFDKVTFTTKVTFKTPSSYNETREPVYIRPYVMTAIERTNQKVNYLVKVLVLPFLLFMAILSFIAFLRCQYVETKRENEKLRKEKRLREIREHRRKNDGGLLAHMKPKISYQEYLRTKDMTGQTMTKK
ncbi:Hypothetical protein SRAE_X000174700 [Strongyloides ratti]|uniref:Uncharacterized protein n=1 Tax=Strongyloides ratti TaxID=34506 RepID=A0A090MPH0_STRRB|nr:Hypothetical protein SRAE_X000174700 [Strongyloides ratti]CEF60007.1 Hypothetical protein SRAE_X000174700 [Strongyloides ratti]